MSDTIAKTYRIGCGDSSCVWGRRGGMATNGGCRCYKDLPYEERHTRHAAVRILRNSGLDFALQLFYEQLNKRSQYQEQMDEENEGP